MEPKLNIFKVLYGIHNEYGKMLSKGDLFPSPRPMVDIFKGKFELVREATEEEIAKYNEDMAAWQAETDALIAAQRNAGRPPWEQPPVPVAGVQAAAPSPRSTRRTK